MKEDVEMMPGPDHHSAVIFSEDYVSSSSENNPVKAKLVRNQSEGGLSHQHQNKQYPYLQHCCGDLELIKNNQRLPVQSQEQNPQQTNVLQQHHKTR